MYTGLPSFVSLSRSLYVSPVLLVSPCLAVSHLPPPVPSSLASLPLAAVHPHPCLPCLSCCFSLNFSLIWLGEKVIGKGFL